MIQSSVVWAKCSRVTSVPKVSTSRTVLRLVENGEWISESVGENKP